MKIGIFYVNPGKGFHTFLRVLYINFLVPLALNIIYLLCTISKTKISPILWMTLPWWQTHGTCRFQWFEYVGFDYYERNHNWTQFHVQCSYTIYIHVECSNAGSQTSNPCCMVERRICHMPNIEPNWHLN